MADSLALRIQQVRAAGLLRANDTFLNLDYSSQASSAPFVFDMVQGTLHRNHCPAIPRSSHTALYALDSMPEQDASLACSECLPEPSPAQAADPDEVFDLVFGALSFLHQFSSVLRERGREFRNSTHASDFISQLGQVLKNLDPATPQQKELQAEPQPPAAQSSTPSETRGILAISL